jgi:uncharacterized protein (UPF0248 family)
MPYDTMTRIFNHAEEDYNEYVSDIYADRVHLERISEPEHAD